jgi:hypothetical protein
MKFYKMIVHIIIYIKKYIIIFYYYFDRLGYLDI